VLLRTAADDKSLVCDAAISHRWSNDQWRKRLKACV